MAVSVAHPRREPICEPLLHQSILHRAVVGKQSRQPLIARVERALPCFEQDARGDSRLVP